MARRSEMDLRRERLLKLLAIHPMSLNELCARMESGEPLVRSALSALIASCAVVKEKGFCSYSGKHKFKFRLVSDQPIFVEEPTELTPEQQRHAELVAKHTRVFRLLDRKPPKRLPTTG